MRRLAGGASLAAALVVLVAGYMRLPDARTCQVINDINSRLGDTSTTCSANLAAGWWVAAGLLAATGLAVLLWPDRRPAAG